MFNKYSKDIHFNNNLTIQDIKKLAGVLRDVFLYISNLKKEEPVAKLVKNPQIPSVMTEALAMFLLNEGKILPELKEYSFVSGGWLSDIKATKEEYVLKIEVKATAHSAFQQFGPKDIVADYLIWIHFDNYFKESTKETFEVFVLKDPKSFFKKPDKITLSKFRDLTDGELESHCFKLLDL